MCVWKGGSVDVCGEGCMCVCGGSVDVCVGMYVCGECVCVWRVLGCKCVDLCGDMCVCGGGYVCGGMCICAGICMCVVGCRCVWYGDLDPLDYFLNRLWESALLQMTLHLQQAYLIIMTLCWLPTTITNTHTQ